MLKRMGLVSCAVTFFVGFGFATNAMASEAWGSANAWHKGSDNGKSQHMQGGHHGGGMGMMNSEGHMTSRLRSVWKLTLTKKQKTGIREIQRDLRSKHWNHADSIDVLSDKLMEMYRADTRNVQAIGKVYGEIFEKRRQMIMLGIEAGNKVEKLLTKEQRKKMKKMSPMHMMGKGM